MSDVASVRYEMGYAACNSSRAVFNDDNYKMQLWEKYCKLRRNEVLTMGLKRMSSGKVASGYQKPSSNRFTRSQGRQLFSVCDFNCRRAFFRCCRFIYAVATSFKPLDELLIFPPRFFVSRPTLSNYRILPDLMASLTVPLSRYIYNSITVSTVTTVLYVIISSMAAFSLSKGNYKYKNLIFWCIQFAAYVQRVYAFNSSISYFFKARNYRYLRCLHSSAAGGYARGFSYKQYIEGYVRTLT